MSETPIGQRPFRPHGPDRRDEPAIQQAGNRVLGAGLVNGDSAFTPGYPIWTAEHADELVTAFNENLDEGPGSFVDKLVHQLRACSPAAIQLAAELQYLFYLPAYDIRGQTKRDRVRTILQLLPGPRALPSDLSAACEAGVFRVGMGFKTQGWRQVIVLYAFVQRWFRLPPDVRAVASVDPWAFRDVLLQGDGPQGVRNSLLYLAFPDVFEPIVSQQHKELICAAFAGVVGGATGDVDRDLFAIRDRLESEAGTDITFYSEDLELRWRPTIPSNVTGSSSVAPAAPSGLDPNRRAWLIRGSSVQGADLVPVWLARGSCSLAARNLPEAKAGMSRDELTALVDTGYAFASYSEKANKVSEFHDFLTRMQVEDVVVTTSNGQIYLGRIAGEPQFLASADGRSNLRRAVDWANAAAPVDYGDLPSVLQSRLAAQQDVVDLTRELPQLLPLLNLAGKVAGDTEDVEDADDSAVLTPQAVLPDATAALADRLLIPQDWLQNLIEVLNDRKQLVLYGPPGTGKTYLAQKIAEYLAGDPQNVKLVQFHPAYSYEDFFEGYRPRAGKDGALGFELRPGPFRRLVDRARDDPGRPYLLIIDELNRANLAKVFGELYFLLEYRDQAIDLLYSADEQGFTLPENVFLIGTMNTADRSIALIDTAMRRRFAFLPLHPGEEPVSSLLSRWLVSRGLPETTAGLLAVLNERIGDHEMAVGPSYFMRESVHAAGADGLRRAWATSILPLLEEHHYGSMTPAEVAERYDLNRLLAEVGPTTSGAAEAGDAGPEDARPGTATDPASEPV